MLPSKSNPKIEFLFFPKSSEDQIAEFIEIRHTITEALSSGKIEECENSLNKLRVILSAEQNPEFAPLDEFMKADLHSAVFAIFKAPPFFQSKSLVGEAVWILANICCAGQKSIELLISMGILELFSELAKAGSIDHIEHVVWALSNMMGEDVGFRFEIDKAGLWAQVFDLAEQHRRHERLAKAFSWLFSNAMRGPPFPSPEHVG